MARRTHVWLAAFGGLVLTAAPCPAQPPPVARPTVSPYLNLTRRGTSPALNYYNLVRPQNQFYSSIQQLQQQVGTNRQEIAGLQQQGVGLPATGHPVGFMTQAPYFMTMGGGAAPLSRSVMPTSGSPVGGGAFAGGATALPQSATATARRYR